MFYILGNPFSRPFRVIRNCFHNLLGTGVYSQISCIQQHGSPVRENKIGCIPSSRANLMNVQITSLPLRKVFIHFIYSIIRKRLFLLATSECRQHHNGSYNILLFIVLFFNVLLINLFNTVYTGFLFRHFIAASISRILSQDVADGN